MIIIVNVVFTSRLHKISHSITISVGQNDEKNITDDYLMSIEMILLEDDTDFSVIRP